MAISVIKHKLAFEILQINFQMEKLIEQAPESDMSKMNDISYDRYTTLQKTKSGMINELKKLMVNDGDI
ncbi:unnamed protein product [Rotaria socialis]|uniref:Uncharacterized protein n=1 Tax=Rotaria socialis TaxID=392032 RepID=A0A821G2Y9_9BILA|nr:unnamed protein product [Rotaria socialis]